jgi:subtilisin family serine protease
MPLTATGAADFVRRHPTYDGRGVLVGILDSGIDPAVPGLAVTTTGQRKVLDIRDFSAEGRIRLTPLAPRGDTVVVGTRALRGFGRVIAVSTNARYYAGTIEEIPLGTPAAIDTGPRPPSDLNDNGSYADTLGVVVTRATSGWVLFADTDGDGSLDDERPVHDYLIAFESFGWHGEGREPAITMAANFQEVDGEPVLDLVFDNSGHGTHVAGIAAGHDMYGVRAFNGVAPGAQLLGLKIANNAQGGISVTGSMERAIAYALTFAETRRLPLVLNLSFGVGNEREGAARIDHVIDSMLDAHPDVVFTVSAGNDGPGLSTVGFPGSSRRIITVGGSFPLVFVQAGSQPSTPDPVAFFSSRGGELAKPDLIAPGVAYSTVPPWNAGQERNLGTSMAAPHAAGLAALLVSALVQEQSPVTAERIKHALTVTARPVSGSSVIDDGAGVPEVGQAYRWLQQGRDVPDVRVEAIRADGSPGQAAFRPQGFESSVDTLQLFRVTPPTLDSAVEVTLESDAAWLEAPPAVTLADSSVTIPVVYRREQLRTPGVYTGVVSGWGGERQDGPLLRLVNTIVVPFAAGESVRVGPVSVTAGGVRRMFFGAEQDRPFSITVRTTGSGPVMLTSLHEPGGQPYRGGNGLPAGPNTQAALYVVNAGDVIDGVYEVDVIAPPIAPARAVVDLDHAPVRLDLARHAGGATTTLANAVGGPVTGTVTTAVVGAQRELVMEGRGPDVQWVLFRVPGWATDIEIDVEMKPEEWPKFTDFGVTLFDSIGRIITRAPLNYAGERLRASFTEALGEQAVKLGLYPGLAEPGSEEAWSVRVEIRLYAGDDHIREHASEPMPFALDPSETKKFASAIDPVPSMQPGVGFVPLYRVAVLAGRQPWIAETPVGPPPPQQTDD